MRGKRSQLAAGHKLRRWHGQKPRLGRLPVNSTNSCRAHFAFRYARMKVKQGGRTVRGEGKRYVLVGRLSSTVRRGSGGHFDVEIKPAAKPTNSVASQGGVSTRRQVNLFGLKSSSRAKVPRPAVVAVQSPACVLWQRDKRQ